MGRPVLTALRSGEREELATPPLNCARLPGNKSWQQPSLIYPPLASLLPWRVHALAASLFGHLVAPRV